MTSKRIWGLVAAALLFAACGDYGRGEPAPEGERAGEAPGPVTGATGATGFAPVLAILQASCAGCHTASSASALRFSGNADADYATVQGLVDLAAPVQSRLLQKASGETAHGGGAVLDPSAAAYQTILNWITAGAAR
jgi:hypothetical protein